MSMSGGYQFYLSVNPKKPELADALKEIADLTGGFNNWQAGDDERASFKASLETFQSHDDPDVRSVAAILSRRGAVLEKCDEGTFRYHTLVTQHTDRNGVHHDDSADLSRMTEPLKYPIGVQFGLLSLTVVPNCGTTNVTGSVTERGRTTSVEFSPCWQPSVTAA